MSRFFEIKKNFSPEGENEKSAIAKARTDINTHLLEEIRKDIFKSVCLMI